MQRYCYICIYFDLCAYPRAVDFLAFFCSRTNVPHKMNIFCLETFLCTKTIHKVLLHSRSRNKDILPAIVQIKDK